MSGDVPLPTIFVDSHHHFLDTRTPNDHNGFLQSLMGNEQSYLPEDYDREVVQPISNAKIQFVGSVHVEALPVDGVSEVAWLESLMKKTTTIKAIVASCDLTRPAETVDQVLTTLSTKHPLVRGIRWILDVADDNDQTFVPDTYTHIATKRHNVKEFGTIDYLKVPAFEQGLARLVQHKYSFDLQTAPGQLTHSADLFEKYPDIPVVIDHFGSLRYFVNPNDKDATVDDKQVQIWKDGMQAMAKLPHCYCKLSMLGRVVPDWHKDAQRQDILKQLLRWVVLDWFGPQRCMAALNWHVSAEVSDSSEVASTAPSSVEFVQILSRLLPTELTTEQRNDIFANNARRSCLILLVSSQHWAPSDREHMPT